MSEEPKKVELETADLAAQKRAALEELAPGVIADGVLDATRLGELLDAEVTAPTDGAERFGLMWSGKQEAVRSLLTPSRGTLIPDLDESIDFDTAEHVFIEGDNLEVLKLLQKAYNDRVKLIYIDPPYNTGNDFVYEDDFSDSLAAYLKYTAQLDSDGNRVSAKADMAGRLHSRWLSMMYPRLVLARNLLTQDGIFAVSIDDNEAASLKSILDEVFGPENFLNTFVWVSNLKGRQITGSGAAGTKEYVHVYARDAEQAEAFRASAELLKSLMPSVYKGFNYEILEDEHGPYVLKNELHNTNSAFNEATRPNLVYDIYFHPGTRDVKTEPLSDVHVHKEYEKIGPKKNNNGVNRYHAFRWSTAKVAAETHNLEFVEKSSGYKVFTKVRDVDSTAVKDLILGIGTSDGSRDLEVLGLDPACFDYPKPASLLQILTACTTDRDSLVLDFFAGSGSTTHGVVLQNEADGGNRRTVLVNLPEPMMDGSDAEKAGLGTVSNVTRARLSAVVSSFESAGPQGLRSFRLDESNFGANSGPGTTQHDLFDLAESTLRNPGRLDERVAVELLLKEGVPLDAEWTRAAAGAAEVVAAHGVAVVLSLDLTEEIVMDALAFGARVVVFLEDGFAGADAVKANAVTNARNLGITLKTV
jgi:adenine-specific DNA-methyltransferase